MHNRAGNAVAFMLSWSKGSSNLLSPSVPRYANTRHPAVRYSAYVRQRPPLVLLRLLHLWDSRCAALGRAAEKQMFPRQESCHVSTGKKSPPFLPFSLSSAREILAVSRVSVPPGCSQGWIRQHHGGEHNVAVLHSPQQALSWAVTLVHRVGGFKSLSLAGYFLQEKTQLSASC